MNVFNLKLKKVSPEQLFMGSVLLVNGGNYLYNLLLGRIMGPKAFAEAALLVTLLLVLSFIGMTFQLVCAKFGVLLTGAQWQGFKAKIYRKALWFGGFLGLFLILFAKQLQQLFHTDGYAMYIVFGFGVPFYLFMSINRGIFQGHLEFKKLSITYQTEMWSRLLITMLLLLFIPLSPGFLVALGIFLSLLFGLYPSTFTMVSFSTAELLTSRNAKKVSTFIWLTAGYEFTQIIINNSDVLMVKHYFDAMSAGLYATLALIGRVVYFVAWMFVMLLLPAVIQKKKEGKATAPTLFKYLVYIGVLSSIIVVICYLFPETVIGFMFGNAYLSIAALLWQYALVTSLFAIANIFTYYFLSLDQYIPVILSAVFGFSQVFLISFFHETLEMVVLVQLIAMIALLCSQLLYFIYKNKMLRKHS